ncbi:MAG: hypothetical protein ACK4MF_01940 [Hyphomicrobiaceae bacterium]
MIAKKYAVATLAVAIAVLGAAGSAEAGKRGFAGSGAGFKFVGGGGLEHSFHHHQGFGHKRHFGPKIIIGLGGGGCGYYYDRWKFSGSRFWKAKYFNCIS